MLAAGSHRGGCECTQPAWLAFGGGLLLGLLLLLLDRRLCRSAYAHNGSPADYVPRGCGASVVLGGGGAYQPREYHAAHAFGTPAAHPSAVRLSPPTYSYTGGGATPWRGGGSLHPMPMQANARFATAMLALEDEGTGYSKNGHPKHSKGEAKGEGAAIGSGHSRCVAAMLAPASPDDDDTISAASRDLRIATPSSPSLGPAGRRGGAAAASPALANDMELVMSAMQRWEQQRSPSWAVATPATGGTAPASPLSGCRNTIV